MSVPDKSLSTNDLRKYPAFQTRQDICVNSSKLASYIEQKILRSQYNHI